jgi:prophage regulatory protein
MTINRLLRRQEVEALTGVSCSAIYRWMADGAFPKPVKLGTRKVAWRESDIAAWIEDRSEKAAAN